ncbi:MAG: biosynthetic-type acetolactate synthase large subunit [Desulfovibrio sp.]|jgi:acetolactate synthase-1/2/3 large subunit|nr:biosynthetic-type acetolactate synthase large subunit [Desulfovibrio sp.]
MELTGAQILMECLEREGVDLIFGYPGGSVIDIYDELSRHPAIRHILVRHEQAAVHAADGYARALGKTGVCLVTSGPGATNAVTGIATAYSDSIPLVIFTGQVPTHLMGNDAFQEVDIIGITRPCVKHSYLVNDISKMAEIIRQAFFLARSGRPGPVLVDLPRNVITASGEFVWPEVVHMRSYHPTYKPNLVQIRRAADLVLGAVRPLILSGGGVIRSDSSAVLAHIARSFHIPVVSTLMGLGGFPGNDPLWFGMVGMHGSVAANRAIGEADVLLAVGTRFADRVTGKVSVFASRARIIHIDIDPTSIRKNVNVDVPIVADCLEAVTALKDVLATKTGGRDRGEDRAPWLERLDRIRREHPLSYIRDGSLKPQEVIEAVCSIAGGDNIVVSTEVGQHQMWTAQFFTFTRPRSFLSSGGLGTMGYGLPAAMGAQLAMPDKQVVCIAGDGSIQMNSQEFITIVSNRLPVKVVVLNNGYLGMVRQWQELFFKRNYSCTNMEAQPDFLKLAEAYGAEGYRITEPGSLIPDLTRALTSPNPAIIDVHVAREENVYPMVPAGAALDEMILV